MPFILPAAGGGTPGPGTVGTSELATGAVTSDKIADGTVVAADVADGSITLAKQANLATDKLIGRSTSGTGVPEAVTCTAAGRALLDDAAASDQRTTLGLGSLATQNGTFSGTSSGTNTGDQTISLTGDVTGSGTDSFAATLANDAVTYSKMQNVSATDKALGRSSSGSGDVEEIPFTSTARSLAAATSIAATVALLSPSLSAVPLAMKGGTSLGPTTNCGRVYFDPATWARTGKTTNLLLECLMDASTNLVHTAVLRNLTAGSDGPTLTSTNETTTAPPTRHTSAVTTPVAATVWELRGSHNGEAGVDTANITAAILWISWS